MVTIFGIERFVWPTTAVNSQLFVLGVCIVIIITAHVAQNSGLLRTKGQLGSPVLSIFRHVFHYFFGLFFVVVGFLPSCIIVKWILEFS